MKPKSCLKCKHHKVIPDPDPNDSFCSDDMAVVCTLVPNPNRKPGSRYLADHHENRPVTVSCRPYKLKYETNRPGWCPL